MDLQDAKEFVNAIHVRQCPNPVCAVVEEMSRLGDVIVSKRERSRHWVVEWTVAGRLYQGRGQNLAEATDDCLENQRAGKPVD